MKKKFDKRIKLLSEGEITDIYGLPQFTEQERIHYFSLGPAERIALDKLIFTHSKVHFILQLGYFKDKKRLFHFKFTEVLYDVLYIMQVYFPSIEAPKNLPSRNAVSKNQNTAVFDGGILIVQIKL